MVPRNTLFHTKYYAMRFLFPKWFGRKIPFFPKPTTAVFTSGSGGCQAANGIKGSEATDYAGLTLD